jgi:hypothetical protein
MGTIAIGSISQTDNIYLYNNQGEKEELVPDIDKKYHMGNEAKSAVEFIKNHHSEHLKECQETNYKVLVCMEKMRVENA